MNKVDEIFSSIRNLPPFPQVAQRAMRALDDPECTAKDLVDIIEYDQAITANILRICNSAYFGLSVKIGSLHQAISYIGQKNLMTIILATSVLRYYSGHTRGYDLEKGELWSHSVACALLSNILAKKAGKENPQTLFTGGLLHDIGKLVMSAYVEAEFKKISELVQNSRYSFLEAEEEVLGTNHAEVGSRIVELWNFPPEICNCIRYHHKPREAKPDDHLTPIIYLADMCCLFMGIGVGEDGLGYRCYPEVLVQYGLKQKDFDNALKELDSEMAKAEEIIRMA